MTIFRLIIIYDTTEDNCDGSPWPPDDDDNWAVVRRMNGRTKWRRIALEADRSAHRPIMKNNLRTHRMPPGAADPIIGGATPTEGQPLHADP